MTLASDPDVMNCVQGNAEIVRTHAEFKLSYFSCTNTFSQLMSKISVQIEERKNIYVCVPNSPMGNLNTLAVNKCGPLREILNRSYILRCSRPDRPILLSTYSSNQIRPCIYNH